MFWVEGSEFGGSRWGYLQSHQPLSEFRPYNYHHRPRHLYHRTILQKRAYPQIKQSKTYKNNNNNNRQTNDNIKRPSLTITPPSMVTKYRISAM